MRRPGARRAATLAVVAGLVLTGCGVRLDTPPPEVPSPDAAETVRQDAAVAASELAALAAAASVGAAGEDTEGDLAHIGEDATAHLRDLGGVWTPPPRPDDPTGTTPPPRPTDPTPEAVLTALDDGARSASVAASADPVDGDLATLLTSVAINRALWAQELRSDLGLPDDGAAASVRALTWPTTLGGEAAQLCRTFDAAGYVAEVLAARSDGPVRASLAARAEEYRWAAEQVAVLAGLDGTAGDPREPAYAVDPDDLAGTLADLEGGLVPGWLAQVAGAAPPDRAVIGTLATQAALRHRTADEPVTTYPGLGD